MIGMTERAASELRGILEANEVPPDEGVKLIQDTSGNLNMLIAPPSEGDEVHYRGGAPLLIVDHALTGILEGTLLDVESPDSSAQSEPQFTLVRPDARE